MSESAVEADWYADPSGVHQLRYWDGSYWTEHVADNGTQGIDPLPSPADLAGNERRAIKEAERQQVRNAKAEARALANAAQSELEAIEHKSVDGTARITGTHLVFEYSPLARVGRKTKKSEIPLEKITGYEIISGATTYLRVSARGWSATPEPAQSALTFALHPRKSHEQFVSTLVSATGAASESITAELRNTAQAKKEQDKADEQRHARSNPAAHFGSAMLRSGLLHYELKKVDMTEAHAEATLGAPGRRSTFTRMGAGALIAGPAGLIVGAVARKDTSKCYVTIEMPDGVIVVEGRAKDYPSAVKFADAVNRSRR
ncbi:hypothetical protein NS234_04885 [Microbacterium oxydans]|uniref:DUF2510 domain-containing protein n=1 Tax=Microbacterium oxydans TaxID=82380 RepID=UPI00073422AF|nr:DUF2510 domain-containing protein [Microbacterium oxydans]KTR78005.1 hypothetical protein NS234_04885 [Microbacterium oxydans]